MRVERLRGTRASKEKAKSKAPHVNPTCGLPANGEMEEKLRTPPFEITKPQRVHHGSQKPVPPAALKTILLGIPDTSLGYLPRLIPVNHLLFGR